MQSETKKCQNCKKDFTIEPEDFNFYEKIKVPPPTFCPECRLIRRMLGINERFLYFRKCDLTNKRIMSVYPEDTIFPVYHIEEWLSDKWDPYSFGQEYDSSKSFFQQFIELRNKVPRMSLARQGESINSEYTHRVTDMKNCYMVFRTNVANDSMYCYVGRNINNCVDCFSVWDSELCYECIDCNHCYKTRFSQESHDCQDSFFLYSCRNCSNCVGCVNLINKSYCILNEKFNKDEYFKRINELKLNTSSGLKEFSNKFEVFRKKFPVRSTHSIRAEDTSGNWLVDCKNVKNSLGCLDVKNGKYLFWIHKAEDCMDYFQWGNNAELVYESSNCGNNLFNVHFCDQCWSGVNNLSYCDSCISSNNCFGCVGLKRGEYSILNKKYTKYEYERIKEKIINDMYKIPYIDKLGKEYYYGEFFPAEFSLFSYNETPALDFFPKNKEETIKLGYKWSDNKKNKYQFTLRNKDIPENISSVDDSLLNEVIECEEKDKSYSTGGFRITQNELSFYRKMDLPLPRVCFDVRHIRRLLKRRFSKIINRKCSKCGLNVNTVYPESFAPIIYCESCYQSELY